MHEFFSREPDPIDALLRPQPADNETLRQAVYAQTRHLLQRRRRLRQLAYAASLLASFAVGAGAMRLTSSGEQHGVSPPVGPVANTGEPTPRRSPLPDESALAREWIAFDSEEKRGELYRQAGDRYLTQESDPQSALRCYGNALNNGSEQELTFSTDDNWLLMAIKDARQKEKNHATNGG